MILFWRLLGNALGAKGGPTSALIKRISGYMIRGGIPLLTDDGGGATGSMGSSSTGSE
nr:hypothetical protein Q903MT_gene158 [Picea sitchensis]